jgi:hypothetical protein
MKYKVFIPLPKAKRMVKQDKKVVLEFIDGFDGCKREKVYLLKPHKLEFEFEVPNGVDYIYNTSTIDGSYFNIFVEYSNESGSRTEKMLLVPSRA